MTRSRRTPLAAQSPQSPNVFLAVFLRFHWCQIRGGKSHRIRPKKHGGGTISDSFFSLSSLNMETRNHFGTGTLLFKATTHANRFFSHCASTTTLSHRKVCFSTVNSPALLTWLLCSAAAGVRAPAPLRHSGPESQERETHFGTAALFCSPFSSSPLSLCAANRAHPIPPPPVSHFHPAHYTSRNGGGGRGGGGGGRHQPASCNLGPYTHAAIGG